MLDSVSSYSREPPRTALASAMKAVRSSSVVTEVSWQGSVESYPVLAADGLSLYFTTNRKVGASRAGFDVWGATRTSRDRHFVDPHPVIEMNTDFDEYPLWLSPDGCTLLIETTRGSDGQSGRYLRSVPFTLRSSTSYALRRRRGPRQSRWSLEGERRGRCHRPFARSSVRPLPPTARGQRRTCRRAEALAGKRKRASLIVNATDRARTLMRTRALARPHRPSPPASTVSRCTWRRCLDAKTDAR